MLLANRPLLGFDVWRNQTHLYSESILKAAPSVRFRAQIYLENPPRPFPCLPAMFQTRQMQCASGVWEMGSWVSEEQGLVQPPGTADFNSRCQCRLRSYTQQITVQAPGSKWIRTSQLLLPHRTPRQANVTYVIQNLVLVHYSWRTVAHTTLAAASCQAVSGCFKSPPSLHFLTSPSVLWEMYFGISSGRNIYWLPFPQ